MLDVHACGSTCNPFPVKALSKRGTPIEANRVPKNPPCCFFVSQNTGIQEPVFSNDTICFFCASVR